MTLLQVLLVLVLNKNVRFAEMMFTLSAIHWKVTILIDQTFSPFIFESSDANIIHAEIFFSSHSI